MADIRIIPSTGLVNVTGSIDFTSGGSTMLFMTGSSRNVGIGTTNPGAKLEVNGTSYFSGLANFAQTATTGSAFRWGTYGTAVSPDTMLAMNQLWNGSGWTILNASFGTTAINLGSAEASPTMRFETGGANTVATTKMIILNNGNVGIGTDTPGYKLQVQGTAYINETLFVNGITTIEDRLESIYDMFTGNTDTELEASTSVFGNINFKGITAQGAGSTGTTQQGITWHINNYGGTTNYGNQAQIVVGNNGNVGTFMGFFTSDNYGAAPVERLRIQYNGNIGIGTTNPGKNLDVVGSIRASTTVSSSAGIHFKTDGAADSGWDALTFRATTEWGDTSAYGVLGGDASEGIMIRRPHIVWSSAQSDAAIRLGRSGGSSSGDWFGVGVASSNVFFIRRTTTVNSVMEVDNNGSMVLGAGSNYLVVLQGGNIGINTTAPANKLQVVGGVTATSFTGSLLGNASTATSATSATSASFASTAPYSGLTGTVPTWNQNTTGNAATATNVAYSGLTGTVPTWNQNTTGNAATATDATNINVTEKNDNVDYQVLFSTTNGTGYQSIFIDEDNTHLTYNPSTRTLSSATLVGALTGNASTATTATTASFASTAPYSGLTGTVPTWNQNTTGNAATATAVINTVTGTNSAELVRGNMADNDQFRILVGGTATNAGFVEIATADDGTEPIHVRQYTGVFTSLVRTATLLDGSGNTSFPGTLTAGNLSGTNTGDQTNITGNAGTATTLQTARTFTIGSTGKTFDGSANVSWTLGEIGAQATLTNPVTGTGTTNFVTKFTGTSTVGNSSIFDNGNVGIGISVPVAKLHVTGSADVMLVEGSGSTSNTSLFAIDGNNGRLFEVSDDLSDSLFSVNTIAGLPVIEAFADNTVVLGAYNKSDLVVTGSSIGIGTPRPIRALDVYSSGSQIVAQFSSSNATSVRIRFSDANTASENVNIGAIGTRMAMWTNNTERMSILSGGSVGIGTTNPGNILEITSTNVNVYPKVNRSSTSYEAGWKLSTGGTDNWYLGLRSTDGVGSYHFYSYTTNSSVAVVQNDGNVGIGVTNPSTKLTVNGTSFFVGEQTIGYTNAIQTINGGSGYSILRLYASSNAVEMQMDSAASTANVGTIGTYSNHPVYIKTNNTNKVAVATDGNVGIGITSPTQLLHIVGTNAANNGITLQNTNASGNSQLRFLNTSGTERAAITYVNSADAVYHYTAAGGNLFNLVGGNVGIGTASPAVLLHIYGSGNTFTRYTNTTSAGHYIDVGANSAGESFVYGYGAYPLLFGTNGTERMRILSGGNVGIGTTSPTAKLHVSGGDAVLRNAFIGEVPTYGAENAQFSHISRAAAGEYSFLSANDGETFINSKTGTNIRFRVNNSDKVIITSAGNVGINTTSPSTNLHVQGSNLMATFRNSSTGVDQYTQLEFIAGSRDAYIWLGNQNTTAWAGDGGLNIYTGTGNMDFWTAATQKMRLTSSGNLGINTTSPIAKLDIRGGSDGDAMISMGTNSVSGIINAPANMYINADSDNNDANGVIAFGFNKTGFSGGSETLRLLENGNVGIGTTNPVTRLHIGAKVGDDDTYTYDSNTLMAVHQTPTSTSTLNDPKEVLLLARQGTGGQAYGAAASFRLSRYENAGSGNVGSRTRLDLVLAHQAFLTSPTTVMSLQSSGNVGIGTTSPSSKFEVYDSANANTVTITSDGANEQFRIRRYSNTNEQLIFGFHSSDYGYIQAVEQAVAYRPLSLNPNGGNVGIGTTAPRKELDVQGRNLCVVAGQLILGEDAYSTSTDYIGLKTSFQSGTSDYMILSGKADGATYVSAKAGSPVYIRGGGNVATAEIEVTSTYAKTALNLGIGTVPDGTLHIDSGLTGATTYALRTDAASLDYALYVSSSGNVAIGGLVPAAALNHKLTVFSGSIALRGPNNSLFSYRLNDTAGVNRNALYVSSSNYLNVGNAAFAGLELFHTGSAPSANNGNAISRYYGIDESYYLSEPNKWLAVRINNVNYVMPMYEV